MNQVITLSPKTAREEIGSHAIDYLIARRSALIMERNACDKWISRAAESAPEAVCERIKEDLARAELSIKRIESVLIECEALGRRSGRGGAAISVSDWHLC